MSDTSKQADEGASKGPDPPQGAPALCDRQADTLPVGGGAHRPAILDEEISTLKGVVARPSFLQEVGEFNEVTIHPMVLEALRDNDTNTNTHGPELRESERAPVGGERNPRDHHVSSGTDSQHVLLTQSSDQFMGTSVPEAQASGGPACSHSGHAIGPDASAPGVHPQLALGKHMLEDTGGSSLLGPRNVDPASSIRANPYARAGSPIQRSPVDRNHPSNFIPSASESIRPTSGYQPNSLASSAGITDAEASGHQPRQVESVSAKAPTPQTEARSTHQPNPSHMAKFKWNRLPPSQ